LPSVVNGAVSIVFGVQCHLVPLHRSLALAGDIEPLPSWM
jgi:hypothetical protein